MQNTAKVEILAINKTILSIKAILNRNKLDVSIWKVSDIIS